MAKSTTSSKRKVAIFSIKGWDAIHYKTTDKYAKSVERIMDAATADVARIVANNGKIDLDKEFSFRDYPLVQKQAQSAITDMVGKMTATIEKGSRKEWLSASKKGDAFLASIMDTSKVKKTTLAKMQDKNLDALSAFQSRKVDGMDLSQRVWKYADQYKDQLELAIDVGLGQGRSADELSRDVRQCLKDPNRLFRRVRDKHGNLVLSKNARAFHPGQGVYRSSYKNAIRLTRSEINMAYRESDYLRWQQLDFVIGIEIHRSNHEPLCKCKLCDQLKGKYPKTFKFKGWHPQCMCYATPILMDDDDFDAQELSDLKSALHGTPYKKLSVKGVISDVPDGFKDWMTENADAEWSSTPYFVRDNFVGGDISKGLKPSVRTSAAVVAENPVADKPRVPYAQLDKESKIKWFQFKNEFYPANWYWKDACETLRIPGIDEYLEHLDLATDYDEWWREDELRAEYNRINAALKIAIANMRAQAVSGIDAWIAETADAAKWVGTRGTTDKIQYLRDALATEDAEEYPTYQAIVYTTTHGMFSATSLKSKVDAAKTAYNDAITKAKDAITKYTGKTDVAKLIALVNEQINETRYAVVVTNDIMAELALVETRASAGIMTSSTLDAVNVDLGASKIAFNEVKDLPHALETKEIIERLCGGDMTSGSCASVAFAFAANYGGMDVLDFRGGKSCDFFSRRCVGIVEQAGGKVVKMKSDYDKAAELLKDCKPQHMYYFTCAKHASIVRKTDAGGYEYLELQSSHTNGWKPLTKAELKSRFGAQKARRYKSYVYETKDCIVDIKELIKNPGFRKMMGYINTAESEQKRGAQGGIK